MIARSAIPACTANPFVKKGLGFEIAETERGGHVAWSQMEPAARGKTSRCKTSRWASRKKEFLSHALEIRGNQKKAPAPDKCTYGQRTQTQEAAPTATSKATEKFFARVTASKVTCGV
jgi:hypothetical protein